MTEYLPAILEAAGVVVTLAAFFWRIQKNQEDKHQKEIASLRECLTDQEKIRRNGDHELHERINKLESDAFKDISNRLSHIEGQLKGINNITHLMESWMIENGGKVK